MRRSHSRNSSVFEEQKNYECACCLEDKPATAYYYTRKTGKRYLTCKDCKKLQQQLCKRLEQLGYRFTVGVFGSLERTKVINTLLDAGILKPTEVPRSSIT